MSQKQLVKMSAAIAWKQIRHRHRRVDSPLCILATLEAGEAVDWPVAAAALAGSATWATRVSAARHLETIDRTKKRRLASTRREKWNGMRWREKEEVPEQYVVLLENPVASFSFYTCWATFPPVQAHADHECRRVLYRFCGHESDIDIGVQIKQNNHQIRTVGLRI